ncbi:MAG: alpha/beta hydrolase [Gemmatimonadota bacterium]|jgi:pimeloyl-ACP methyl ester carboxylesterase
MSGSALPLHVETLGLDPEPGVDVFVLVHGYGASSFSWRHWAPRLAELGHVVLIDLKGFGRAPKPDDDRYAPADQARLVLRLIEERDLRDITLVGHSLGGGVALLVALDLLGIRPDAPEPTPSGAGRLRRLVIVSGAAYAQRMPPFVSLADWPNLSPHLFRLVGARKVVKIALRGVVHDPASITAEQIDGYAGPLDSPDAVRVLLATASTIEPPDLPAIIRLYPKITVPTLLLWGRKDRVVPLSVGERLAEDLPDARLHVLDRCGHLPAEEASEESLALLERFLAETADRPPTQSTTAAPDATSVADDSAISR